MSDRRRFLQGMAAATALAAVNPRRVLGANDRLRVGIIGCGRRGLLNEVLKFGPEANAEVTAVCDTWRQQREAAVAAVKKAQGAEPKSFVHYQDLLALKDVDSVIIGTPDHQHCRQLVEACRAGKDAYVEKPLAMEMKELQLAYAAVKRYERVVQMGTQVRSWAGFAASRRFVQEGGLGQIFKVEQSRNSYEPYWHRYAERPVAAEDVDWKAFLMHRPYRPFDADQYAGWYGYREFSRGPHTNLMVHFIDTVHYVTGAHFPSKVMTMGGTYRWKNQRTAPDSVEVLFEYPEGFLARYCTTFGTSANSYMKFFGTRGVLSTWPWNQPFNVSGEGAYDKDKIQGTNPLPQEETTHHMKDFLECCRSRKAPLAPIEAGYAHSIAVLMADESMVTGSRVIYDPAKKVIRKG